MSGGLYHNMLRNPELMRLRSARQEVAERERERVEWMLMMGTLNTVTEQGRPVYKYNSNPIHRKYTLNEIMMFTFNSLNANYKTRMNLKSTIHIYF